MANPFRPKATNGNPFRFEDANESIAQSALSPLMKGAPFAVERESMPVTPMRRSKPLPAAVTTAPAPKKFERALAKGLSAGTRKTDPFGAEDMTEAQRQQAARASFGRAMAEDIGKAVVGQPLRTAARSATGAARLLRANDAAKKLAAEMRRIEEETAPETGIGAAARLGTEVGAFLPSGLLMGAFRSGLEGAAGPEGSTANLINRSITGRDIESPTLRALADVGLDLTASAAGDALFRGGGKMIGGVLRRIDQFGNELGDAVTRGIGEGAAESADLAGLEMFRNDGYVPRTARETNPARFLTARASEPIPTFAEPPLRTPSMAGPAIPTRGPVEPITDPARILPRETTRTIPIGAEPAPASAPSPLGPAIPTPSGVVRPEGPASSTMRLLSPQSEALRQRLFWMPAVRETVEEAAAAATTPAVRRRTRDEVLARRPEFQQPLPEGATPEEIAAYAAGKAKYVGRPRPPIEVALEQADELMANRVLKAEAFGTPAQRREALSRSGRLRRSETARGPEVAQLPDEVLEQTAREVAGEIEPPRGGERPAELPDEPVDALIARIDADDEARAEREAMQADRGVYSDGSPRLSDEEVANAEELAAAFSTRKKALTDRELEILAAATRSRYERMASPVRAWRSMPVNTFLAEQGTTGVPAYKSLNKRKGTTVKELRERYGDLSEEMVNILEEQGYDVQQYLKDRGEIGRLTAPLSNIERKLYELEKTIATRHNEALAAGRIAGDPMPMPPAPGEFARTATPKPRQLPDTGKPITGDRAGFVSPTVASAVGGAGAGFTAGLATDQPDDSLTPLQRALLYGAGGAAAGAGAAAGVQRAMRGAQRVAPSIPELAPIAQTINTGERTVVSGPSIMGSGIVGGAKKLYNEIVSETFVLNEAAKMGGGERALKQVKEAVARSQGAGQSAKAFVRDTLTPILSRMSPEEVESLRGLMKARRDLDIRLKGGASKSGIGLADLQAAVNAGNANSNIAAAADAITRAHRELLDMRRNAGLLTDEAYQAIKASDDFYTPLYREIAQTTTAGVPGSLPGAQAGQFSVSSSGVRRMDRTVDSLEQTADPLEMIAADALRTFRDVRKQQVANVIFELADQGTIPFIQKVQVNPANPPRGEGVIQQVRNGKVTTYRITDPDLVRALGSQDVQSTNGIMKVMQALKNVKTAGIVVMPDFAAANVIRDVAMSGLQRPDVRRAAIESVVGGVAGGAGTAAYEASQGRDPIKGFLVGAGIGAGAGLYARPFAETMAAMKHIVAKDDIYRQFLADGASTEGFHIKNANDAAKLVKELADPKFQLSDIVNPKSWWEALRIIGSVGEQSTRLAAYKQVLANTQDAGQAVLAAQDRTLRFANIGAGKGTKFMAQTTPFWNAKVQGWDKLGRMMREPKTYALGAAMLMGPSFALWLVNKDNPEYWERPIWEKNLFWLVPKGGEEGGFWRIPKPFELGYMFASLPERALDYATQSGLDLPIVGEIQSAAPIKGEAAGGVLRRSAKEMAASTFEGTTPLPEFAKLPAQLMAGERGYDFFRDRPIVTNDRVPTEQQVTPESSALARALAKIGVAPEKTDFAVREMFGTAGQQASSLIDVLARQAGADAPDAPSGTGNIPLVGRFAERFQTSNRGLTDTELMAREKMRELEKIESGFREIAKAGNRDEALAYVRQHRAELKMIQQMRKVGTVERLSDLSKSRREVMRSKRLTPEQRQSVLESLRRKGSQASTNILATPSRR